MITMEANLKVAHVIDLVGRANDKIIHNIAATAVANIQASAPTDTGFMRSTAYAVTKSGSVGNTSAFTAVLSSRHNGNPREYVSAGADSLGDASGIVGVGAVYAIFVERKRPFVFPSVERAGLQAMAQVEQLSD